MTYTHFAIEKTYPLFFVLHATLLGDSFGVSLLVPCFFPHVFQCASCLPGRWLHLTCGAFSLCLGGFPQGGLSLWAVRQCEPENSNKKGSEPDKGPAQIRVFDRRCGSCRRKRFPAATASGCYDSTPLPRGWHGNAMERTRCPVQLAGSLVSISDGHEVKKSSLCSPLSSVDSPICPCRFRPLDWGYELGFHLGSPNIDMKQKEPWLNQVCFMGFWTTWTIMHPSLVLLAML